jgi:2-methylcitrate dehydratase PrpD
MEMGSGIGALATWAASFDTASLPVAVRRQAALVLVDDLGAMVAARTDPEFARLVDRMVRAGGPAEASIFDGRGVRTDRYTAASANAAAGTWCELDEGYRRTFCHAGVYVLPALLAEAEATDATVADVLRALALGYEVVTRIARGFPGTTRDLHPHGCFSAVGAAAGVALLRGHPAGGLREVVDTACCFVNPTPFDQAFRGAMARNVFAAIGVGNGMRAADWTLLGITALDTAPVGVYGRGLGAGMAPAALAVGLGEDWAILSNFQRIHACCQFGHSTIEATLGLLEDLPPGRGVDDLLEIVLEIHPLGMHLDSVHPTTTLGARFSMPHIAAAATRLGHADVSAFSLDRLADPGIAGLRERVVLVPYEPTPSPPLDRPVRVTWRFADGTARSAECESARGEPGRAFSEAEIVEKLESYAAPVYPRLAEVAAAIVALDDRTLSRTWRSVVDGLGGSA